MEKINIKDLEKQPRYRDAIKRSMKIAKEFGIIYGE